MTRSLILLSALLFLGAASQPANAACNCVCVAGKPQAVCQSQTDVPPVCMPRTCPTASRLVDPAPSSSTASALAKSSCPKAQILNAITHEYEWKAVCK